jgi:hypothetical protein
MSQRVYVDTRAYQLQASRQLIQQAMSSLQGQRSTMSCGHAEVRTTQLDSMREANTFQNVRMQDKMETRQTNALQDKLTATAPDYTVEVLGDWKPQVSNPTSEQYVDIDEAGNQSGMKLIEDLECAALDGARMMIFEVDDGHGNTSYKIGLEDSLFDDQGNWLNPEAKKAYDSFLSAALAAQRAAIPEDEGKKNTGQRLNSAMRAAGLEEEGSGNTATGGRQLRFGTAIGAGQSTDKPKTHSAGNDD